MLTPHIYSSFFFFNDTATTEIYTLSLHDALPILASSSGPVEADSTGELVVVAEAGCSGSMFVKDRKSTRLNSSHTVISYAVFCLKKKNKQKRTGQGRHQLHNDCPL